MSPIELRRTSSERIDLGVLTKIKPVNSLERAKALEKEIRNHAKWAEENRYLREESFRTRKSKGKNKELRKKIIKSFFRQNKKQVVIALENKCSQSFVSTVIREEKRRTKDG